MSLLGDEIQLVCQRRKAPLSGCNVSNIKVEITLLITARKLFCPTKYRKTVKTVRTIRHKMCNVPQTAIMRFKSQPKEFVTGDNELF